MAKTDNLTDFLTDLANTIRAKKPNLVGPINAQDFSNEIESISGGTQPTLFAPNVVESTNNVAWSTNTKNGGFNVTTVGRIDTTEVSSPLTITSEMNGKTLYITSSAENFNASDVVLTLNYVDVAAEGITINSYNNIPSNNYIKNFYLEDYFCPYNNGDILESKEIYASGNENSLTSIYAIKTLGDATKLARNNILTIRLASNYYNKYVKLQVIKNDALIGETTVKLTNAAPSWKINNVTYLAWIGEEGSMPLLAWQTIYGENRLGEVGTIWKFILTISETENA